jgi:hypothetical protein
MHSIQAPPTDEHHNHEIGNASAETHEPRSYGAYVNTPPPYDSASGNKQGCCEKCDECDDCGPRTVKSVQDDFSSLVDFWTGFGKEIKDELFTCTPKPKEECDALCLSIVKSWVHVPYFPAFHRPGWLLRYVIGPFDREWGEWILADIVAGITIALTLIPQVRGVKNRTQIYLPSTMKYSLSNPF